MNDRLCIHKGMHTEHIFNMFISTGYATKCIVVRRTGGTETHTAVVIIIDY